MNEQASFNMQVLDALLLDYATGALSLPLEVLVETHLAMNEDSAKTMNMLMKLGGVLLEDSEPVSLSEGALENVLKAIEDAEESAALDTRRLDTNSGFLPRPISDYIPNADHASWRRIGLGLFECDVVFDGDQGRAKFYRIAPGTAVLFRPTPILAPKLPLFWKGALRMRQGLMVLAILLSKKRDASINLLPIMMANVWFLPLIRAISG